MKIRIDVPCYNRKKITELCLIQLNKAKIADTEIRIYNDNSTEYDNDWLSQFGTVKNYEMPSQPRWSTSRSLPLTSSSTINSISIPAETTICG